MGNSFRQISAKDLAFLFKVMESCNTPEQLDTALPWAEKVIDRMSASGILLKEPAKTSKQVLRLKHETGRLCLK